MSKKKYFFPYSNTHGSVSDTCKTFVQHVSDKYPKRNLFFFASTLLRHILDISTRINDVSNQIYISMRDNIFSFFDSRWIDKDQILLYFLSKLFFNAITCSTKVPFGLAYCRFFYSIKEEVRSNGFSRSSS
jgi:hypothetical protein